MTDKQAFGVYFVVRLVGLLLGFAGLYLLNRHQMVAGGALLVLTVASLLLRPRHLGLTSKR
jgi:hypothetical protein